MSRFFQDPYRLELDAVISGYDRKTCWVQARAGCIPDQTVVLTMQKLMLAGSDVFYALNEMRTDDLGKTWAGPTEHTTLGRRQEPNNIEVATCDFNPKYHHQTGKLLGTGHTVRYLNNRVMPDPRPRDVAYAVYDDASRTWTPWDIVELPDEDIFFSCGAGSVQRWDLSDGTILLPVYAKEPNESCYKVGTLRCSFDGQKLTYLDHGQWLTCPEPRGFCEPSITFHQGRYYLTLRNDLRGYVTVSDDGLNWQEPKPWCFDHGLELGNYNTQQHWVKSPNALYLVYTRRATWNDHVFRHRAPLFMAEVDTDTLTVKRNTERIIVPERGARLGNFQVTEISPKESWITVTEWMQNDHKGFDGQGSTFCEQYGSNNTLWVAKIKWLE